VGIAAGAYEIINSPIAGSLRVALVREGAALASSDAVLRLVFDTVGTGSTTLAIATSKVSGPAGAHLDLSTASASVVVRQRLFVDDPIVPGVTVVRATHITELRALIDQKRAAGRLPAFAWTDSSPLVMSAVHVLEMRAALAAVYAAAGQPAPTYTDATLIAGATVIRAVHINELRTAAVNAP
jgi:hypothetical protein